MRFTTLHITVFFFFISAGIFLSCKPAGYEPKEPVFERYVESIAFQSKKLNRTVRYSVYLPADYNRDKKNYPTVYLLHGYGDNETAWIKGGKIDRLIKELEDNKTIEPAIYVMPQGFNSYYVNRYDGKSNYMDMFVSELVPMVDSVYRTKKDAAHRAVAGYSMGGYGALILPVKNPALFSVSVPLSMSFRTDEQYMLESQSAFDAQWGSIFGGKGSSGSNRLTDYFKANSPFHLFAANNAAAFSGLCCFIDCGDDEESLSVTNNALHELMLKKNIRHEYRMRNGAHTWDYWRSAMREALYFIHSCFLGASYVKEPAFPISEKFSAILEQKTLSGATLNVALPSGYASSAENYPVICFYHQTTTDRLKELKNTLSVLDSLQKEKPFILVETDENQIIQNNIDFKQLSGFIDSQYRTKTKTHNRIGLGNLTAAKYLYDAAAEYPDLLYSVFLFDALLTSGPAVPVSGFIYMDCTDESAGFASVNTLYLQCRNRQVNHQFRVRNGQNTFDSFLNGLDNSIVYIGLMLNKL